MAIAVRKIETKSLRMCITSFEEMARVWSELTTPVNSTPRLVASHVRRVAWLQEQSAGSTGFEHSHGLPFDLTAEGSRMSRPMAGAVVLVQARRNHAQIHLARPSSLSARVLSALTVLAGSTLPGIWAMRSARLALLLASTRLT
jgi:hypothetical protein